MSSPNAAFAASLGRLRHERRWSQRELGGKAGISMDMVSRIECRKSGPSLRTAVALATALGTTIDAMLGQVKGCGP